MSYAASCRYQRFAQFGPDEWGHDDDDTPRLPWLYEAPKWATALCFWIESVGVELRDCEEILAEAEHQGYDLDELLNVDNRHWAWPVLERAVRSIYQHEADTALYL